MRLQIAAFLLSLPALCACSALPTAPSYQEEAEPTNITNATVVVGLRTFDEDDWEPVEEQPVFGIEVDQRDPDESFGWETALLYSSDDGSVLGTDVDGSTTEFSFGIRKTFSMSSRLHPYVGVGLAGLRVSTDVTGGSDDEDNSFGAYAHGGLYWNVGQNLNLGFDVRGLFLTDVTLNGVDADADYLQFAFTAGLAF